MRTLTSTNFSYQKEAGRVTLWVELPEQVKEESTFYLIKKRPGLLPPVKWKIPYKPKAKMKASVEINFEELFSSEPLEGACQLIFTNGSKDYQCKIDPQSFDYYSYNNGLYQCKPYLTTHGTFGLYQRKVELPVVAEKLSFKKGMLSGEMTFKPILPAVQVEIGLKGRNDITEEFALRYPVKVDQRKVGFELPLAFDLNEFEDGMIYDLYVIYNSGELVRTEKVATPKNFKADYARSGKNSFYLIKPYKNNEQLLSLYIKQEKMAVSIVDVIFNKTNGQFSIEGLVDNEAVPVQARAIKIVLKLRDKLGKEQYSFEIAKSLEVSGEIFAGSYPLESLPIHHSYEGGIWDVFIRLQASNHSVADYPVKVVDGYLSKNYHYFVIPESSKKIKPYVTGARGIALYTAANQKKEKLKIALFGSQMITEPFLFTTRTEAVYQVVLQQNLSSMISMTGKPVVWNDKDFKSVNKNDRSMLKQEFEKSFFTDLEQAAPDYLIIDLMNDVVNPLIQFVDSQLLTLSSALVRTSYMFNEESVMDTSDNHMMIMNAMDTFISSLTAVIPAERIILATGRLINDEEKEQIKRNNRVLGMLESYFLSKLPETNVLDLTNTPYRVDAQHQGKSDQEFVQQLNAIVLDKQVTFRSRVEHGNLDQEHQIPGKRH
ncbi:hypothetical protein I6J18_19390 [Peribacillus psychrosaccharolyticus]|uniref:Uncharacterized protein n=2 Tax=Peribacillus psychrosaccharolyticus TaxID=1407 RepID=A0A974NL91_PERPY|nr:DUF6270 domain-containing protein [Peribacillus psychrosaccharolyticus]MEC2054531.1 DUF6270 domain-containing protein [Peribacillus psychrosaccharolyticus]MED3744242.1 DUF6270 domain-containing protein [Peribacillus psychrosaccharolyticus]QQS99729.1 hypothetical protein I6J18_19390 [Peribacillus psychrosaccharolyticus]